MKKLIFAALLLSAIGASAQQDTLKYRINLTDKAVTDYALDRPEEFLSKKAIERRQKQGLAIDSTDLPVCRKYVDAIRKKGDAIPGYYLSKVVVRGLREKRVLFP